jgi:hypothetical protein
VVPFPIKTRRQLQQQPKLVIFGDLSAQEPTAVTLLEMDKI